MEMHISATMMLAFLGGVFSLLSTSLGAFLILTNAKMEAWGLSRFRLSIDFALGLMLSAVAFSLFGPELLHSWQNQNVNQMKTVLAGFAIGILFIGWTHKFISWKSQKENSQLNSSHLVLSFALIFHNLPEGMGAGASLAGLDFQQALPIQIAIAVQNIPEGLILAICLKSFGWSTAKSILGSVGSGFVEFAGAVMAGFALTFSMQALPFLLSLAGGAMLMSVVLEVLGDGREGRLVRKAQFLTGFAAIPLMNIFLGF